MKSLIEKNSWSGIEDYFHHLGRGLKAGGAGAAVAQQGANIEPSLAPSDRELAKAEKLSLEEGGKDARGLLSGLRRRKRPLSWRGHRDGPQHPDPDPGTQTSMHTSGALPRDRQLEEMAPGVLLAHPSLLFPGSLSSRFSEPSVDQGPGAGIPSVLVLISIV